MKKYKAFHAGGDPRNINFLAEDLNRKLDSLQKDGWEIDSVSKIDNSRAWDMGKQMYVTTPEYIIIAKREEKEMTLFCEECGITETNPSFGQQYCRYCGTKFKNKGEKE